MDTIENKLVKFSTDKLKLAKYLVFETFEQSDRRLIAQGDIKNNAEILDHQLSDIKAVLDRVKDLNTDSSVQLTFDAEYLMQLAEVVNMKRAKGQQLFVTLTINKQDVLDYESTIHPMLVTGNEQETVGILMPARSEKTNTNNYYQKLTAALGE